MNPSFQHPGMNNRILQGQQTPPPVYSPFWHAHIKAGTNSSAKQIRQCIADLKDSDKDEEDVLKSLTSVAETLENLHSTLVKMESSSSVMGPAPFAMPPLPMIFPPSGPYPPMSLPLQPNNSTPIVEHTNSPPSNSISPTPLPSDGKLFAVMEAVTALDKAPSTRVRKQWIAVWETKRYIPCKSQNMLRLFKKYKAGETLRDSWNQRGQGRKSVEPSTPEPVKQQHEEEEKSALLPMQPPTPQFIPQDVVAYEV